MHIIILYVIIINIILRADWVEKLPFTIWIKLQRKKSMIYRLAYFFTYTLHEKCLTTRFRAIFVNELISSFKL